MVKIFQSHQHVNVGTIGGICPLKKPIFPRIPTDFYIDQIPVNLPLIWSSVSKGYNMKKHDPQLAVTVFQGTGAILDANKFGYGKLGTYGAGPCCIVAAHCPDTKRIFMAHIDNVRHINSCCEKINYWLRDDTSQQVNIHLLSGSGSWDLLLVKMQQQIKNHTIIQCELNTRARSSDRMDERRLILDTNGGYTSDFDICEVSSLSDIERSCLNMSALCNAYSYGELDIALIQDEKNSKHNKRPLECRAPDTERIEPRKDTYCGFKPGFLL